MPRPTAITGIFCMLASTAAFVLNDSLMKLASVAVPTFELLFLRAFTAVAVGAVLIIVLGQWRTISGLFELRTLLRGAAETIATFCFMLALLRMPIADVFAIAQTVPLFLIFGAALVYRDRITPLLITLAIIGLAGSLLVAQPGFEGLSMGALLAFACALLIASRDLIGRSISSSVPVMVVTVATSALVMLASAGLHLASEVWIIPPPAEFSYAIAAGVLIALGQAGVFLAYRLAPTSTIAPLFYSFAVWSVLSGFFIFGEVPNTLAILGMLLIVVAGLALIHLSQKQA